MADCGMVVCIDDEEGALIASFDGREVSYPADEKRLDHDGSGWPSFARPTLDLYLAARPAL